MPFGLGIWEIVILLGVLALLFGAKGVPDVARRLGTGVREVKDAVGEVDPRRMLEAGDEPPAKPTQAKPTQAKPTQAKPTQKPPSGPDQA
jgi:sec-independent protein translocase protein TatA